MIQPIKYSSNVSFGNGTTLDIKNPLNAQQEKAPEALDSKQDDKVELTSQKEQKPSLKIRLMNILKTFNNVKDTTQGAIRGTVEGAAAFGLISVASKKAKEAKGQIGGTIINLLESAGGSILSVFKSIPSLITKAPVENVKNAASLPIKFCKRNLSKNAAGAVVATVAALAIAGLRVFQGKVSANKHNADLDHKLNEGHIKTK